MKILVIFTDMIRANLLSHCNQNVQKNEVDNIIEALGGTLYNNCFSDGPDTPRGMASFATGLPPHQNGCDSRIKWPRYFLKKELKTIYDLFLENNYKMTFFSNPNERETGLFPEDISELDIHNSDYNLGNYLKNTEIEDNHLFFISLPDFHWSLDDSGYTTYGIKDGFKNISLCINTIFDSLDKEDFDQIYLFSDHGFKFIHELKKQPKYMLLNEDRTQITMFHHKKEDTNVIVNNKLCSITDFYATFEDLLTGHTKGIPFHSEKEKDYIIIEDHIQFMPSVNLNIELWSITTNYIIYIRSLETAYIIDRKTGKITENQVIEKYDSILLKETSFAKYYDEYNKVFKYRELILKQTCYMHGGERKRLGKLMRYLTFKKDLFFHN